MKNTTIAYIALSLIIIISIFTNLYINRGWSSENKLLCSGQSFYSKEDLLNGYLCVYREKTFEECNPVKTELNTDVRECTCLRNNKLIKVYCDTKVKVYKLNDGYKQTDEDEKEAQNLIEEKYNISLSDYGLGDLNNIGDEKS